MIIVTTTRHPNPRVRSLCNDLARALPNAVRVNRGKMNVHDLAVKAFQMKADRVVIVGRGYYGNPGRITFLHVSETGYSFYPLIIGLKGTVLMREMKETSPPGKVKNACVVTSPDYTPKVKLFPQALAEALGLFYMETDDIKNTAELFDNIIYVEFVQSKNMQYVLKFLNPVNLKPSGPKLFIRKVVFRKPAEEEEL